MLNKVRMMNPRVDEELIDNLVCGTLTGPEYRRAILALEAQPQKWRDCALAFLQEQAISQDMVKLSQSDVDWKQVGVSPTGSIVASEAKIVYPAGASQQRDELSWLYKLGSLAALLLLSFSVGWIGSSFRDNASLVESEVPLDRSSTVADSASHPNLKVDQVLIDQVLPENNLPINKFGSNNYSFVGNKNTALLPIDEKIPENLARLEREGRIRIETTTAIMPVECESGTVLIPVQQLRIVPVLFSY